MHAVNSPALFDRPPSVEFLPSESLVEKYRPKLLRQLVGQDTVVAALTRFIAKPYPVAFLLSGSTGTGKTTAALALANELGCVTHHAGQYVYDMGGLRTIASGSQGVEDVRTMIDELHNIPFYGSGWRVVVCNEVDRMSKGAEAIWLDALENIPDRCVIIFTTNEPAALSQRFKDRCDCLEFESAKSDTIIAGARQLIRRICEAETGSPDTVSPNAVPQIMIDGHVSFRRLVQNLGKVLRNHAATGAMQ